MSTRKIISIFVEFVFWMQFFITPVGIGGLIALFIYISNEKLLWLSVVIAAISVVVGVLYAERVRKKHGTSRYASRIIGTPDIWPDEFAEEIEVKRENKAMKDANENDK